MVSKSAPRRWLALISVIAGKLAPVGLFERLQRSIFGCVCLGQVTNLWPDLAKRPAGQRKKEAWRQVLLLNVPCVLEFMLVSFPPRARGQRDILSQRLVCDDSEAIKIKSIASTTNSRFQSSPGASKPFSNAHKVEVTVSLFQSGIKYSRADLEY